MNEPTLRRVVAAGTASQVMLIAVQAATNVFRFPLGIFVLGADTFGVWLFYWSFFRWFLVAETGPVATVKTLIPKLGAAQRPQAYWSVIRVSFVLAIVFSSGILVVLLLGWLPRLVPAGSAYRTDGAFTVVYSLLLLVLVDTIMGPMAAGFFGEHQTHVYKAYESARSLVVLGALAFVWLLGPDDQLAFLSWGVFLGYFVLRFLSIGTFFSKWPAYRKQFRQVVNGRFESRRNVLPPMSRFWLLGLSSIAINATDNIVIGYTMSPSAVTAYAGPFALFTIVVKLIASIQQPLWPVYSAMQEQKGPAADDLFRRSVRLVTGLGLLVLVAGPLLGPLVIRVWMGENNTVVGLVVWLLSIYTALTVYGGAHLSFFNASIPDRSQVFVFLSEAITNVMLSIALVQLWGTVGVIAGTVIAKTTISTVYVSLRSISRHGFPPAMVLRNNALILGGSLVGLLIIETGCVEQWFVAIPLFLLFSALGLIIVIRFFRSLSGFVYE